MREVMPATCARVHMSRMQESKEASEINYIYMYVCMYVCIYVCMYGCMYVCICMYVLHARMCCVCGLYINAHFAHLSSHSPLHCAGTASSPETTKVMHKLIFLTLSAAFKAYLSFGELLQVPLIGVS